MISSSLYALYDYVCVDTSSINTVLNNTVRVQHSVRRRYTEELKSNTIRQLKIVRYQDRDSNPRRKNEM